MTVSNDHRVPDTENRYWIARTTEQHVCQARDRTHSLGFADMCLAPSSIQGYSFAERATECTPQDDLLGSCFVPNACPNISKRLQGVCVCPASALTRLMRRPECSAISGHILLSPPCNSTYL